MLNILIKPIYKNLENVLNLSFDNRFIQFNIKANNTIMVLLNTILYTVNVQREH